MLVDSAAISLAVPTSQKKRERCVLEINITLTLETADPEMHKSDLTLFH